MGKTAGDVSFWSLSVPQETRAYIPRLLALAEVVQNPQRYHVELADIPHEPYFEEVNIGSQIDLNHAAKLAGISYRDLIKLNPGFNRWATAPYRPYKLLVPADKAEDFTKKLANLPDDQRVSWTRHKVSVGDDLVIIANKYHTTVNLIKELNQLKTTSVKKGQFVIIPNGNNTVINEKTSATPNKKIEKTKLQAFIPLKKYKVVHIVQTNETYQVLQKKYGVSLHDIQSWNHLGPNTPLKPNQQLVIWRNG